MTFIIKKQGTLLRNHEWTSVELKCGHNIVKYLSQNIQVNQQYVNNRIYILVYCCNVSNLLATLQEQLPKT